MRCRFTGGRRAVVTSGARTRRHASVIKRGGFPSCCAVTCVASLCGRQMIGGFASGCCAVMTSRARTRCNTGMGERSRLPGGRSMA
jgi:hypothetical protein